MLRQLGLSISITIIVSREPFIIAFIFLWRDRHHTITHFTPKTVKPKNFSLVFSKITRFYRKGLFMIYFKTNAVFNNTLSQPKETYTLLGKSDIPPFYTYSDPLAPPNMADGLLPRAKGYSHISHIIPKTFDYITYPNNGWAWIYNSDCQNVNLPLPCQWDILAENNSNGIKALTHFIKYIGQYNDSTMVELPEQIEIFAMFNYNNTDYSLYILATYDSTRKQSIAHYLYVAPFDASSPRLTTNNIQQPNSINIFEYVSNMIDSIQQTYRTKVRIFNANISDNLTLQPV